MWQPGCTITRSPSTEWVIELLGPTVQSRPILTLVPITALALMMVPGPISAPAPITAPGSTVTSPAIFAVGCTDAPAATPRSP